MTGKERKTWICDGCGKEAYWEKGWRWLIGIASLSNHSDSPNIIYPLMACSDECEEMALNRVLEDEKE